MKKYIKKFYKASSGFSILELLVVVSILGVLAAVAGLNIGKYIGTGEDEAFASELHNIQTAISAMISESSTDQLDSPQTGINDMDLVTADSGDLVLTEYLKRLGEDGIIRTGCYYSFSVNGTVTQQIPEE